MKVYKAFDLATAAHSKWRTASKNNNAFIMDNAKINKTERLICLFKKNLIFSLIHISIWLSQAKQNKKSYETIKKLLNNLNWKDFNKVKIKEIKNFNKKQIF